MILICKALSDTKRLEIVQILSDGEKCGCKIPLDSVFSTFVKGDFLYVMCRGKVYFILDLESGLWRLYLPMHRPPRLKVLWWRIQETTRDLVWLVRHWKD